MNQLLQVGHPLLACAALLFTLILSLRLLRRSKERITPAETLLAQAARVAMLLLLPERPGHVVQSQNARCIRPSPCQLAAGSGFADLPIPASLRKTELSIRWHGWMFVGLFVAYLIISAAAFWPIG